MPAAFLSATSRERLMTLPQSIAQIIEAEAEFVRAMFHQVEQLGVAQQRFGRNAAPVQAGATGAFFFHARHAFSKLRGANGTDISGRSAANDNQVVVHKLNQHQGRVFDQ